MNGDSRLEDIEVKISYVEKHVADLDALVRELGDTLVGMQEELKALRGQLVPPGGEKRPVEEDVPPHY